MRRVRTPRRRIIERFRSIAGRRRRLAVIILDDPAEPDLPDRGRGPGRLGRRRDGDPPRRARGEPAVRHLVRVVLERLGPALRRPRRGAQDDDWPVHRDGLARARRRPGGPVHRLGGLDPGRPELAETRRVEFRDGGPPGPLQLERARAPLDPRGPLQDHPGQASRRDHPRQPRGDRPARQAGRRGVQRRLHRQGRPEQRGHPPPGPGRLGPTRSWSSPTTARGSTPTARPS